MTEIYRSETKEVLIKLWAESQQNGNQRPENKIWKKIIALEEKEKEEKLSELRNELNLSKRS